MTHLQRFALGFVFLGGLLAALGFGLGLVQLGIHPIIVVGLGALASYGVGYFVE